jgi:4'-phosphopantetheinyl transferase
MCCRFPAHLQNYARRVTIIRGAYPVLLGMTSGSSFELSGRGVHVWTLRIAASRDDAARFEPILAPDEKDRAARFRFDHLQRSFIVTRGALRRLLGGYLNRAPASLLLVYGAKGKPALEPTAGIHFNVTHSGGLAVFAFTAGCEIGVDVEWIRPLAEMRDIAGRFFCAGETATSCRFRPVSANPPSSAAR